MALTTDSYAQIVGQRIDAERVALAERWLAQLQILLPVPAREVFPSRDLLDHIPALVREIARYLGAEDAEEIAANAAVIDKARELGLLRHAQRASVHQLLREYELLAEILESFVASETARLGLEPASATVLDTMRRLMRAIRTLMRTTVDTFVSEYTSTIERQTDQLKSYNRMASHELRSPVGTILVAAALMQRDEVRTDPERARRIVETIRANAERLTQLLNTLHGVARLDGPIDAPSQQVVEVATLGREVARQLSEMARARQVDIQIDDRLPTLLVDPARLELILLNLVSNAIKYSDPAKDTRFVAIEGPRGAEPSALIHVRDNGLGIPDTARANIFDRFFRAHAELDPHLGVDGSGLGLAIVAECVEALGAILACESQVGHGTTFTLTLPQRSSAP